MAFHRSHLTIQTSQASVCSPPGAPQRLDNPNDFPGCPNLSSDHCYVRPFLYSSSSFGLEHVFYLYICDGAALCRVRLSCCLIFIFRATNTYIFFRDDGTVDTRLTATCTYLVADSRKNKTKQVSKLPAGLTDRWDKDRRFSAAWSLVRELRPSGFLTTSSPRLDGAQEAYESLGAGGELGVVFRY